MYAHGFILFLQSYLSIKKVFLGFVLLVFFDLNFVFFFVLWMGGLGLWGWFCESTQWPTGPHDIARAVAFVAFFALAMAAWWTIAAAI
jgi:hypothetical protein